MTRQIFRITTVYMAFLAVGFLVYLAMFRLPLGVPVLFYKGLALAVLTAAILLCIAVLVRRRFLLDTPTIAGGILLSLGLNVCFLVIVPVTIDRSISVFLLARLEAQPLTADSLRARFEQEYIGTMRQIPRRVVEQELSGNIAVQTDGLIQVTPRGRAFLAMARTFANWFGTDPRFVNASQNQSPAPD